MYEIEHQPSGDWAEAEGPRAAISAARTLITDNDGEGTCRIKIGKEVRAIVWPGDGDSFGIWTGKNFN